MKIKEREKERALVLVLCIESLNSKEYYRKILISLKSLNFVCEMNITFFIFPFC